jgi:hypothetical protein
MRRILNTFVLTTLSTRISFGEERCAKTPHGLRPYFSSPKTN